MHIFSNVELKTSQNLTIRERLPMYIRKNNFDSQCLRFVNVVVSGRFAALIITLNFEIISLGILENPRLIKNQTKNFILILAKQFIFKYKHYKEVPTLNHFKNTLKKRILIEQNIALEKDKITTHEQKWRPFLCPHGEAYSDRTVRPSVGPSVRRSVRPSVGHTFRFRSLTVTVFIQSSPNFLYMLLGIKSRSSSITGEIALGTSELWPFN